MRPAWNWKKIGHRMNLRHSSARQALEASCVMPCSIIAAGSDRSASSTPMRIMPPAIPRIPEMKDVTTAEIARIE